MSHRISALALVCLALPAAGGCRKPVPPAPAPEPPPSCPAFDDPSKPIEIETGKEFSLRTESHAGVAPRHSWRVGVEPDPKVVVFVRMTSVRRHHPQPGDEPIVGGTSDDYRVYRAVAPGTTNIELWQGWAAGQKDPPDRVLKFTVVVRDR